MSKGLPTNSSEPASSARSRSSRTVGAGHVDDRRQTHQGIVLDHAADLDPVDVRHRDVEDQQVGMLVARSVESLAAGGRFGDPVTRRLEDAPQQRPGHRLVIGDEHIGRPCRSERVDGRHPPSSPVDGAA